MTGFYESIRTSASRLIGRLGTQGRPVRFSGPQEIVGEPFRYVQGTLTSDNVPATITRRVDTIIYVTRDPGMTPFPVDGYIRLVDGVDYIIVGHDVVRPADVTILDIYYLAS